jgi:DNA-binding NarL/FixJ family response regulator
MTTVLIADDDHLMRAGLVAVLESDERIRVIGQASTGREAVALTRRREPDVVLMDVQMPDLDGIAATRELTGASPAARILILTTFEEDGYIFRVLRAGASGFMLKRTRPEELIRAVHTIAAGESLLSPSVTRRVAGGLSNAEIAAALVIEESTVKTHVKRIPMKLGLRDRVRAVIFAYEHGVAPARRPSSGQG